MNGLMRETPVPPRRHLRGGVLVAGLAAALSCADSPTATTPTLSLEVTPDSAAMVALGEERQLDVTFTASDGATPEIGWVTRDIGVVGVDDAGLIRAIGPGDAWIVARAEHAGIVVRDSARVSVRQVPASLALEKTLDTLTWLGATTRLTARAFDALGSPIADAGVEWFSQAEERARVDSTGIVTALDNGEVLVGARLGDVSATIQLTVAQSVASVTVTPAAPSIDAGTTQPFSASAFDGGGSPVSGVNFLWVSANANVATVDTTGLATGTGAGTVVITALGRGEPGNAVLTVGPSPVTATQIAFTSDPTDAVAGEAISPAVEVELRDGSGNLVTSARNQVTLTFGSNPGGGTLSGTKTVTAVNGIASFSGLSVNKAASGYDLTASATGLTGATSAGFEITPAAPAKLDFGTQPANVEGNVTFASALTVTILDAFDNVVTNATDAVTISLSTNPWASIFSVGGQLNGTITQAAVGGTATFADVSIDKPATGYRLSAEAAGLVDATSDAFDVSLQVQALTVGEVFATHTCTLATGGTFCWGRNFEGQLGQPQATGEDSVAGVVQGGLTFVQVSAGEQFTCGLTAAGEAYCWGRNTDAQLGLGSTTPSEVETPTAVTGGLTFSSISAGGVHACGISGTDLYCWGRDSEGQVGDDATFDAEEVSPIIVAGGHAWASVDAGYLHTCGVTTGGDAYCWGWDQLGQLGDDATLANQPQPVIVAGGQTWSSIEGGYRHTCAVNASQAAYCWGEDSQGQLGDDATLANMPTPVVVFGGLTWTSVGAGFRHSCGLTTTGDVYCWGENQSGELGDGNNPTDSGVRVLVAGGLTWDALSVGYSHSCGLVGTDVYCWGRNFDGQLGDGSRTDRNTPVQIVQ